MKRGFAIFVGTRLLETRVERVFPLFLKKAELGIFLVYYFARNFYLNEQIFDPIDNWNNDD